ncbi:MAG: 4Fe-4S dicluster domain-containing protein [Clostridiaceae bacterium]|nr:4Fe-4S dicluster domain-containing protein [Clostridiaceae bacterium]
MLQKQQLQAETIRRISGVNTRKCMKCGKCTATCPAHSEMDISPHRFVSMVENNEIDALMSSDSLWKCLSCFACVERCPRGVEPANLIEAVRVTAVRMQNRNRLLPENIPSLLNNKLPQQALVSAFRKYSK